MGLPITGALARATQEQAPYAGAAKWGNGINAIHAQYAGPPRPFGPGVPNDLDDRTPPAMAGEDVEYGPPWGAPNDPSYLDASANEQDALIGEPEENDGWPEWGDDLAAREIPPGYPSWNQSGQPIRSVSTFPRGQGVPNPVGMTSDQLPSETVSEGWINKGVSGHLENSTENPGEAAPDSQVFVQTSYVQRDKGMSQPRTLNRSGPHQDVPRSDIAPRKAGPKIKNYSGGLRHYDMFPRQIDDIPRPFYFRTAGTGPSPYLYNNAMRLVSPLQRTPPPDPSMGLVDTALTNPDDPGSYGYTSEEWGY